MHKHKGFTLIELLIVIAIIAIIAAIVFVALNPLQRFQDSRDSRRWSDINGVLDAIKIDQIDNGGTYVSAVTNATAAEVHMIGTAGAGCDGQNANCDVNVTSGAHCVDLTALVTEGYLGAVPISPQGNGTWSASLTGYTMQRDTTGIVTVRACESENTSAISVTR